MPLLTVPYAPRYAFVPFHQRTQRDAVLICHRRAGKTVAIANDAPMRALAVQRDFKTLPPARIGWMYPTRVRAKDIAWGYLKFYTSKFPGVKHIESELAVEFENGARVTLYGADNSRGVGLYLDGIYFDEADQIPQRAVSETVPALADYQGFMVFAGMLEGRYNLWKRYEEMRLNPNCFSMLLRASESGIIPADELAKMRMPGVGMGEAAYQIQMECNVNASIAAAIYGKQMDELRRQDRIKPLPVEPSAPMDFFFDIGHSMTGDDWSMWAIQLSGREILIHAYYANTGEIPAFYAAKIREIQEAAHVPLGTVYLPHDGARKDRQGRTAADDLRDAGIQRIKIVSRTPHIWDGINTLRELFPRFYINAAKCCQGWHLGELEMPSGVDCLDFYTKKEDASTGMILEVPVHDQYSHGADALRTFAEAFGHRMIEGTSDLGQMRRSLHIDVSRERVSPSERTRAKNIRVTR